MDQQAPVMPPPPLSMNLRELQRALEREILTATENENEIADMRVNVREREEEIVIIRATLEAKETEYVELLRDFNQRLHEATAVKERELQMAREISDVVNQRLETQLAESMRDMDRLRYDLQAEINRLNVRLHDEISISTAIRRESEDIHQKLAETQDIKRKNDSLVSKVDHYMKISEDLKSQLKEQAPIISKVEDLEAYNKVIESDINSMKTETEKNITELLRLSKDNASLKRQNGDLSVATINLKQKTLELETKNDNLQKTVDVFKKKITEVRANNSDLKNEIEAQNDRDAGNRKIFETLKETHNKIVDECNQKTKIINDTIVDMKLMNKDMDAAKKTTSNAQMWFNTSIRELESFLEEGIKTKSHEEVVGWLNLDLERKKNMINAINTVISKFQVVTVTSADHHASGVASKASS